jgi:hypothetical protein
VLAPGRRNDELDDLLDWIANAKPQDAQAIRGEIKRRYYDLGDVAGGNALNAALSNALALGSGIVPKDRQQILATLGPRSQSDEDDETTESLIDAGLLLLGVIPPIGAAEAPALIWRLGWAARGRYLEDLFGRTLSQNFPAVDKFIDGIITSLKSIDLKAATYQDQARLANRINTYISDLVDFDGAEWGGDEIKSSAIRGRALNLIVPKGSITSEQREVIDAIRAREKMMNNGVDVIIIEF